jgi:glycosyltransferase involved in cell wall biosynthesis
MTSFNGEKYIEEQIHSILKQISKNDELIISDDGSTDATIQIIEKISDPRIKIIKNSGTKGYTGNFENAIKHANGDLIFLSDQDDIWLNGRVREMTNKLSHCDLVVCDAKFVSINLEPLGVTYFSLRGKSKGFISNLIKLKYLGACMAFRRKILCKLLPFPNNKNLCTHDLWIALIAEFYYKVDIIPHPLILYRRHDNNVSSGGYNIGSSYFWKLKYRIYALVMVFSRIFKKSHEPSAL